MIGYALETAVFMTVLYLAYKCLAGSTTFHSFNRTVLILIAILSFLLPFSIPLLRDSFGESSVYIGMPADGDLHAEGAYPTSGSGSPLHVHQWIKILPWVYWAGVGIMLIWTLVSLLRLSSIIHHSVPLEGHEDVYVSREIAGPVSWHGIVIVRPEDCDEDLRMVIAHEQAHFHHFHWLDLLVGRIMLAFQWFNPVAWKMFKDLRLIHEYEVDEEVGKDNPYAYKMMLIKKTVGPNLPVLADSLNSNLKIRLTMMMSKRTLKWRRWTVALLVPLAAVSAYGLSRPASMRILAELAPSSGAISGKGSDNAAVSQTTAPVETTAGAAEETKSAPLKAVEHLAEFKGGSTELMKWLSEHIVYPEGGGTGRVIVRFVVEEDGKVSSPVIVRGVDPLLDAEALRVVGSMPDWIPARIGDKPVASHFTIPISFNASPAKKDK